MQKIVLASNNPGKLREFQALLAPLDFDIIPQGQLDIPSCEEPFETFVENALVKARHASAASGLPALADDSGICVDALGGAPGVFSARYAGEPSSDAANNQKLIFELQGKTNRAAHYVCVLAFVGHATDLDPLTVETQWHGLIQDKPAGTNGFGYDPYFYLPDQKMTAAQLDPIVKNSISHRGQALRELMAQLKMRVQ